MKFELLQQLQEHKDWLKEDPTVELINKVCEHLKSEAEKYQKRDDYKGDDPMMHVCKEFCDTVKEKCSK